MTLNKARNRVVGGCLLTMLLPASESLFAQSVKTPAFDICPAERARLGSLTFGAPRELSPDAVAPSIVATPASVASINAMAPWFNATAMPFRVDGVCRVATTVEAPARGHAQLAVDEVTSPGVVQNLRRTDQP